MRRDALALAGYGSTLICKTSWRPSVAGCTDYFPDAARIDLPPGSYRARICYGGLSILNPNDREGDDHYRVVMWNASRLCESH